MAGLPDIVRQRLNHIAGGGNHLDAGLLTGFVEGTLTKAHRDHVLDHLAACSECNRVVALIAPVREVPRVVPPTEVGRYWLPQTALRWASAAAALALVISVVVIGRVGRQVKVPSAPSAAMHEASSASMTAPLAAPPKVASGAPRPGNKPAPRLSNSRQPAELAAASPRPPSPQENPALAGQSRPAVPVDVRGQTAFQTSMFSSAESWLELPAASLEAQPLKAEPPPIAPANVPEAPVAPTGAMWLLSDPGVLQKSNDSGHTWVPVAVPSRVPLRALSVLGQDIWAGGDQGTLYHSIDGGQTWTGVVPTSSNGIALSADIVRIAFSDLRHGWIATREGDIWTTRDSGATWSPK